LFGCGVFHQPSEGLWEQIFPVLYEEDGYVCYFNCLHFHHPSKHAEWEKYVRKLFFIQLQIHRLSSPHFLWRPEFPDVFLARTATLT